MTEEEAAPALGAYADTLTEASLSANWLHNLLCLCSGHKHTCHRASVLVVAERQRHMAMQLVLRGRLAVTGTLTWPCLSACLMLQSYGATMAAKLGLAEYDRGIAAGLMRLMYEDSGELLKRVI